MKHNKKKLLIIIEEFMQLFLKIGGTNITVQFDIEKDQRVIAVKGNYDAKHREQLEEIEKSLNCDRNEEMEECYWSISGCAEIDQESELYIVGSMLDRCTVSYNESQLEIVGYRSL